MFLLSNSLYTYRDRKDFVVFVVVVSGGTLAHLPASGPLLEQPINAVVLLKYVQKTLPESLEQPNIFTQCGVQLKRLRLETSSSSLLDRATSDIEEYSEVL